MLEVGRNKMTGLQQMPDMGSRGRVSNWI